MANFKWVLALAPRPRVAAASRGRLCARAAGEPSGAPPPGRGDARPGFVYLGCVRSCNVTCHYFKLTRGAPHRLGQSHLDPYYELRDGCNSTYRSTDTAARGDGSSRDDASGAGSARRIPHAPAFTCGLRDVVALVAAAPHRDDQNDCARGLASARAAFPVRSWGSAARRLAVRNWERPRGWHPKLFSM